MTVDMNEQAPKMSLLKRIKDVFTSRNGDGSLRDTLAEAIDEHEEDSHTRKLGADERAMLFNITEFGGLRVDDVMVPRADIIALDVEMEFDEMVKEFASAAHSRLPLYRGSLDEVQGMVHVKDVLIAIAAQDNEGVSPETATLERPVLFVPASMKVMDLLAKMRKDRTHMAVVVDEYGGTDGLVTIEDLMEEIVGEIEDEHDAVDDMELVKLDGGKYDVDARIEIKELEEALGLDLSLDDGEEEFDTLGGLVFAIAGRVPEIGETFEHSSDLIFEVVNANPRRITKVRIHPRRKQV